MGKRGGASFVVAEEVTLLGRSETEFERCRQLSGAPAVSTNSLTGGASATEQDRVGGAVVGRGLEGGGSHGGNGNIRLRRYSAASQRATSDAGGVGDGSLDRRSASLPPDPSSLSGAGWLGRMEGGGGDQKETPRSRLRHMMRKARAALQAEDNDVPFPT